MKQDVPLFSIIIPSYNYAKYLPDTLYSAFRQKNDDYEIIVINDGSTDNTDEVARKLLKESHHAFRYYTQKNKGVSATRNKGIQLSRGKYLYFLDSDDLMLPDALAVFSSAIKGHPNTGMFVSQYFSIYPDGRKKKRGLWGLSESKSENFKRYVLSPDNTFACCAVVFKKTVFENYQYPEHMRIYEDEPVWAYVLANFSAKKIEQPVALVRKHEESLRHEVHNDLEIAVADEIFSAARLPKKLLFYRDKYLGLKYLDQFRTLFLSAEYSTAWQLYLKGLSLNKKTALRANFLRKAVKTWCRK